ncbi:hypothetical protein J7L13_03925 [bacterium]|nr:hypothetical protein [bacterium]
MRKNKILLLVAPLLIVLGGLSFLLYRHFYSQKLAKTCSPNENIKIRGLDVFSHDRGAVKVAKESGANWVGIMYFFEVDWDTGEFLPEEGHQPRASRRKNIIARIQEAKKAGLKVLLQVYPEYWIQGKSPNFDTHRIELQHGPFPNQDEFLKRATEKVIELAKFAEEQKVDMFSPWCEMNIFVDWEHAKKWTQEILPKIRKVYSGLVAPPKGEITWGKYGLKNEGDLSYWDFSGYDYVWADVFDSDYHLNGLQGPCRNENDYRQYIRTLIHFLQKLKERSKAKGIILGSEIGMPEQYLAQKVREGKDPREELKNFWRILFEESYQKVDGYFFFPWRGKIATATGVKFKANFSDFIKKYYCQTEPKVEWLRGIGFAGVNIPEAKKMGANIIHLAVFPKILKNYEVIVLTNHSDLPLEEMRKMEAKTKDEVRVQIREAHRLGLKVYLSLYPEFLRTHAGEIPADRERERFLEKMEEIALDWARFAEEEKVEIYSPTTALYSFVGQENEEKWQKEVIPKIRQIYSGELSSRAFEFYVWNSSQGKLIERKNVEFDFSPYDYIGLNFFGGDIPDEQTFRTYIRKNLRKAVELMEKYHLKGITLGEIGYPHTQGILSRIMRERKVSLEKALAIARLQAWRIIMEEIEGKPYIIPFFSNAQAEEADVWLDEGRKWVRFSQEDIREAKKLVSEFLKKEFHLNCDDFNPCTEDFMLAGACVHRPLSGALPGCQGEAKGERCGYWRCFEGKCVLAKKYSAECCEDGNEGTLDFYDEKTGHCIHKPKIKRVLLDERFANFNSWEQKEGRWETEKGKAVAFGRTELILRDIEPQNFYLKLKARVLKGTFCVSFRELNGEAYDVMLSDLTTSNISLEGPDIGQDYADNLDLRSWFELEIIAYKERIDVYFNGKKIMEAKAKQYPQGKIHLRTWGNPPYSSDAEAQSEVGYLFLASL